MSALSSISAAAPAGTSVPSGASYKLCQPDTFANLYIQPSSDDPAIEIVSITASITNATEPAAARNAWPVTDPATIEVCNLTITYTHPAWHDTVNAFIHLPASPGAWNGKLLGIGGDGWHAGNPRELPYAAARGFVGTTTDAGHLLDKRSGAEWALNEDGTSVNWGLLRNFAGVAIAEAKKLGKAAATAFYSEEPQYAYFTGCSTGGRQGHMMAQKYPDLYDGILATAAAVNWDKFLPAMHWPYVVMKEIGYYPPPCELAAITEAAIAACGSINGVHDGITVDHAACMFDPQSIVRREVVCPDLGDGKTIPISAAAATIASLIWDGPRAYDPNSAKTGIAAKTGDKIWSGFSKTANLLRVAGTKCDKATGKCTPDGFRIPADWLRTFVSADKTLDPATLSWAEYTQLMHESTNIYGDVMGTSDPDLSAFARGGGRMLTWHGLTDELIPSTGTKDYYDRVVKHQSGDDASEPSRNAYDNVAYFYRYFEAPGVEHCAGGEGWYPGGALDTLMDWVENGRYPETLYAENSWAKKRKPGSRKVQLCPYPKTLKYLGGNADLAESWGCEYNRDTYWRKSDAQKWRVSQDKQYYQSRWRDEL